METKTETKREESTGEAEQTPARQGSIAGRGFPAFALPSVADLVFMLLTISLCVGSAAVRLLRDGGIGWHIRTGDWILKTHTIPRTDPFLTTTFGKTWYAWEWLYDVAASGIHSMAGLNGIVFLTAVVIALTFALVLRRTMANGGNLVVAMLFLLLAIAASSVHFLTRPHVLSWLFTVIWIGLLEDFETQGKGLRLIWLPLIMVLWVNVHGGFLLGIILLGIYASSDLFEGWIAATADERGRAFGRARALSGVAILALGASLLNPYSYTLYSHIYQYLTDPFLIDHIDEFLSPNFHGLAQKSFAVLILLTILTLALTRSRLRVRDLVIVPFAVCSGLYATRNIPVSSILLVLIIVPLLSTGLKDWVRDETLPGGMRNFIWRLKQFGTRMAAMDAGLRGHLLAVVTLILGVWVCAQSGMLGTTRVLNARFDRTRFPVQATDYLESTNIAGAVFCPDRWGGYLIYRLFPMSRVVVDDRHDLYGSEFVKRYLKIVRGEVGWDKNLAEMHPYWVMVPEDSAIASLLTDRQGWRRVYGDDTAVIFQNVSAQPSGMPH